MNANLALLRCPRSGSMLRLEGDRLVADGGVDYAVEDGIFDLRCHRKDYYFNPVPRPAMAELTQRAAHEPWWRTVRTFMKHVRHNPDWLDNLVADSRYAWKLLLDLKPDATVLDLGCGLGNLTRSLAPHVGRVYAMDLTIERLRFAKQRFAHFNRDDNIVLVAGGDGTHLPFADQSLDVVTLSGVLEWVADDVSVGTMSGSRASKALQMALSFFGERNPRAVQTRFLREIRRVLKPGGQLFVAIENRHNQEYLYRRVDHHSGLRYGSLLPRFVANLYSIAVKGRPYRTYTYSLAGYRQLLRAGGFAQHRFFGLLPGYSHLAEVTPLSNEQGFWKPERPAGLKERLVRHRNHVPAYGIVAGTALSADSLLGRVIEDIEAQIGRRGLKASALRVNAKGRGLLELEGDAKVCVVKLPFNDQALASLQRQRANVLALSKAQPDVGPLLPRSLAVGRLQGVDYFVEARLPGEPLAGQPNAAAEPRWLDEIAALLGRLQAGSVATVALEGEFFEAEVAAPLRKIGAALEDDRAVAPLAQALRTRLAGMRIGRGLAHGQFNGANILVDGGRVSGVIGWEHARLTGLPILDAIDYLLSAQRARARQQTLDDATAMLAERRWPVAAEWQFLTRQYDKFSIDASCHRELVYLSWAHHVAGQLDDGLVYDAAQIERRIVPVLSRFA